MLWAVVMAGGRGTRFWPESRNENPKQFLSLFGKETLLEQTVRRLGTLIPRSRVLVVTQAAKTDRVAGLLRIPRSQVIGEPVGRNTAPCAILAAAVISKKDPDAVLAILPADHRIAQTKVLRRALGAAAKAAVAKRLPVTFGIVPKFAFTGYGYLEVGGLAGREAGFPVYRLKKFHEKPGRKKAERFFKSKRFLWNSGMFVWRADGILRAAQAHLPRARRLAAKIISGDLGAGMRRFFPAMPNISIDYGLMEKLPGGILTMPVDFGWSDMGGWLSLAEIFSRDAQENISLGKTLMVRSAGNIVKSPDRLTVLLGVRDFVVIGTPDALLICPKDQTEEIRQVVSRLKEKRLGRYL